MRENLLILDTVFLTLNINIKKGNQIFLVIENNMLKIFFF